MWSWWWHRPRSPERRVELLKNIRSPWVILEPQLIGVVYQLRRAAPRVHWAKGRRTSSGSGALKTLCAGSSRTLACERFCAQGGWRRSASVEPPIESTTRPVYLNGRFSVFGDGWIATRSCTRWDRLRSQNCIRAPDRDRSTARCRAGATGGAGEVVPRRRAWPNTTEEDSSSPLGSSSSPHSSAPRT